MGNTFYTVKNGLAQYWDRDEARLSLSRWVYHHPEMMQLIINSFKEQGIDLINIDYDPGMMTYETIVTILLAQFDAMSNQDIDDITGVDLDG